MITSGSSCSKSRLPNGKGLSNTRKFGSSNKGLVEHEEPGRRRIGEVKGEVTCGRSCDVDGDCGELGSPLGIPSSSCKSARRTRMFVLQSSKLLIHQSGFGKRNK